MKSLGKYTFLIIGTILVIGACGYFYLHIGTSSPSLTTDTATDTSAGGQLLTLLDQSRSITLDLTVFSNPVFGALVDASEPIPAEPVGRADPFLPLGASSAATTSKSTQ